MDADVRRLGPPLIVVSLATCAAMCTPDQSQHSSTLARWATTTTTTSPPPTTTTYLPTTTTTDPTVYAAWSRVSVCENGPGAWSPPRGAAYPDSLGISAANWRAHNGGDDLSPANQIRVASEIEAAAGLAGFVPDAHGCASW